MKTIVTKKFILDESDMKKAIVDYMYKNGTINIGMKDIKFHISKYDNDSDPLEFETIIIQQ